MGSDLHDQIIRRCVEHLTVWSGPTDDPVGLEIIADAIYDLGNISMQPEYQLRYELVVAAWTDFLLTLDKDEREWKFHRQALITEFQAWHRPDNLSR